MHSLSLIFSRCGCFHLAPADGRQNGSDRSRNSIETSTRASATARIGTCRTENNSLNTLMIQRESELKCTNNDNSDKRSANGVVRQQVELMRFTELRTTFLTELNKPIFESFTESLNHAFSESLLSPGWNFMPSHSSASTCLVRKSASISLVGFLPSVTLPSVTTACAQKNTASMCFTRPSPRRLPIAIPAAASIHT